MTEQVERTKRQAWEQIEGERRRLSGPDETVGVMSRDGMPAPAERLAELNRLLDQLDAELDGHAPARGSLAELKNRRATLLAAKATALAAREMVSRPDGLTDAIPEQPVYGGVASVEYGAMLVDRVQYAGAFPVDRDTIVLYVADRDGNAAAGLLETVRREIGQWVSAGVEVVVREVPMPSAAERGVREEG